MKYLLFGGDYYYPQGGVCDFICAANSIAECQNIAVDEAKKNVFLKWFHIADKECMKIVKNGVGAVNRVGSFPQKYESIVWFDDES